MSTTKAEKKQSKKYSLWMKFNGEEYTIETNDLDKGLLLLKPDQLHTEVYLIARKGDDESERKLSLKQAKRVFIDDIVRQVFVQNLLLN